ncbi:hypothetical protein K505DRAFT_357199 [Melanomma pulvis-pyrius CBS 109.77]|uniref:Rhodopsin domain-containing protein n=1 Tax=Melanomma pulvis-pyrius CBS 109.77 TaxID=1314802 RepID=A0A6A6XQH2_9PLEO|nr:hypothetical protein K505DRAFT_357199 [Melanomma pulvis-pyrius CBS 109.77]
MSLLDGKTPVEIQAFFEGPALKPPPGVKPNFANPEDLSDKFIIMCTVCAIITGLFVGMRFYTRYMLAKKIILEDVILLSGWILFVTGFNTVIYQAHKVNLGAHQYDIRVKDFVHYLRLFHHGTLLFCITMLLLRIAIIMQVLRHFVPPGSRSFTFWAAHILIVANTVFWLALTMMEIFSCRPRKRIWEFYQAGTCIDRHSYLVASGAMNLGTELLIMFLPQRIIWSLALSTKRKLELTPLFLVGTFTCICSAIRLWQTIVQWPTHDLTYYMADAVMLWTVPEVASSVLVPCLPSLPQFIRIIRNQPISSRPHSTMLQMQDSPNWSHRRQKQNPSEVITDMEYHELVMRTETTVASVEREDTGPWVQTPAVMYVRGGKGPTKKFSAPSYYPR